MNTNFDIILISGKQGSGKTTLMSKMMERIADPTRKIKVVNLIFADTIYQIHDFALKLLAERGIKRDIVKDGPLLQMIGTAWGRGTISENIWVDTLKGQIAQIRRDTPEDVHIVFFVSDCRFRNEFEAFPGAFCIRLECPKETRQLRCSQWRENDTHQSEIDLDGVAAAGLFDLYLDTEGSDTSTTYFRALQSFSHWCDKRHFDSRFESVKAKYYSQVEGEIDWTSRN